MRLGEVCQKLRLKFHGAGSRVSFHFTLEVHFYPITSNFTQMEFPDSGLKRAPWFPPTHIMKSIKGLGKWWKEVIFWAQMKPFLRRLSGCQGSNWCISHSSHGFTPPAPSVLLGINPVTSSDAPSGRSIHWQKLVTGGMIACPGWQL